MQLELIDQRQVRAERCRASRGLALAASFKLKHPQAQWQDHSEIVATSWELWEKARNINAVSNLESLANTADSEMRHHQSSYTAWQKVEKAIRSLASDYRWISRSLVPE